MSIDRAPMLRPYREKDMELPAGKTCADCFHFRRCNLIYGHIAADEVCDWAPSRFIEPVPAQAAATDEKDHQP